MKNLSSIMWGIVLIVLGVIIGLNIFEIIDVNLFFEGWWTLFIIIPCFIGLFNESSKTGNVIGILVGTLLLLACQDIVAFDFVWKLIFPIILITIGISFIFKNAISNKITKKIEENNKDKGEKQEYNAVFSGQKIDCFEEEFKGCNINAIFGGIELDLSKAKIKKDVIINASTIFGGVDIRVPRDVNIKINSTSIFGGVEDKSGNAKDNEITIYINATSTFGGVEIK